MKLCLNKSVNVVYVIMQFVAHKLKSCKSRTIDQITYKSDTLIKDIEATARPFLTDLAAYLQGHDCIQFVEKIFMRRSIFNNH